ncbi:MAG: flagellar biosynthesis protein FlhB [Pseudomonadota bacterium]
MAEESGAEKTEEATSKRLEDAAKEGQVIRSRELNMLLSLLGSGLALFWIGPALVANLKNVLTQGLSFDADMTISADAMTEQLSLFSQSIMLALLPFMGLICLLALIGPVAVGGWSFNGTMLEPKFNRLDPIAGIGRMFSVKAVVELVKAIAKVALVGGIAYMILSSVLDQVIMLPLGQIDGALNDAGSLMLWCLVGFSSALLLVAGIDVPYQIWNHKHELMMTKQEVKDEMKESEGRPEVKGAIRRRQQEISQRRMMSAIPKADVVITNPTHYAVALAYDQQGGGAPVVLAKGKDLVAAKIREIAKENNVTILSAPPLARALYASTDINKQIPEDLFVAVAQVLAWIYQLKRAVATKKTAPPPPTNLPVPPAYDQSKNLQA